MEQLSKSSVNRNLLILHLTVLVWGFTGILGALITINAVQLVWFRVGIASIALISYFLISKTSFKVPRKLAIKFFLTGSVVAVHWILFFHAIKIANVSICLICMSSITLITAIIEPLLKKQRISGGDIFVGLLIISGIILIFKFQSNYTLGIIVGLCSAICASLFSTINSQFVQYSKPAVIGFYELSGAFFWVTVYRLCTGDLQNASFNLPLTDWIYLLILGVICTALAYVAGVGVMRTLSAFRVALVTNLEPVYGIILAYLIFGKSEQMSIGFYAGSALILGAVFLYPIYQKRRNKTR